MSENKVCVLQVTNISPSASKEQVYSLFSYIGSIVEYAVYPSVETQMEKFAFIKFEKESCVGLGQHLTNTVFIDRAIVCIPAQSNRIPDEETALRTGPTLPGQRSLPPSVTNSIKDIGDGQELLFTHDPTLVSLGLPEYPPLPANTEPSKVEEIRRTVYVGNLEKSVDGEELLQFLNVCVGEVMYLRMTQENEALPYTCAYVEFSKQASIPVALQNSNTIEFNNRALRIQHSRVAIIKPKQKTADQALEEVEDAIRLNEGREAAALNRGYSPSERRSGSRRRSPSPRRRSRDRGSRRSSDRSPRRDRDKRSSRSPRRRRSRSRDDRDSRRERDRDRSDRDKDRSDRDRDRDRSDRDRDRSDRDRDRESRRDRDRERGDRDRSPEEKKKKKDKERDRDRKEKERKRSRSRTPKKAKKSKSSRSPTPKKAKKEKDRKKSPVGPSSSALEEEIELRRRLLEKASIPK